MIFNLGYDISEQPIMNIIQSGNNLPPVDTRIISNCQQDVLLVCYDVLISAALIRDYRLSKGVQLLVKKLVYIN